MLCIHHGSILRKPGEISMPLSYRGTHSNWDTERFISCPRWHSEYRGHGDANAGVFHSKVLAFNWQFRWFLAIFTKEGQTPNTGGAKLSTHHFMTRGATACDSVRELTKGSVTHHSNSVRREGIYYLQKTFVLMKPSASKDKGVVT